MGRGKFFRWNILQFKIILLEWRRPSEFLGISRIFSIYSRELLKFNGFCVIPKKTPVARRIDIRFIPYDSYGAAILYFTGSKTFNTQMRAFALGKGYSLNEYGLKKLKDDILIPCKTEEEVKTITEKALFQGARRINDFEENEFMYSWAFEDLDGHIWEMFWMDPKTINPS